ncbi:MAG: 23S rRNA (pseudouridine(1915)-N(3))-methyltransferase RlmH [Parasphingorhabdus sp.]|nr:23S rRNA (pseudouridine(1915)-N(3))-methyltransferase RlmH [Parasphingorhabdus sp.]
MKLHIVARGKIGRGAEAELVERYMQRVAWDHQISELPDSGGKYPQVLNPCRIVALDEKGENMPSLELAETLSAWRDNGVREARFLIGAADGLDPATRASADLLLSFGRATWPHLMVRAMLAEQLWRATAIVAGHPYHREG